MSSRILSGFLIAVLLMSGCASSHKPEKQTSADRPLSRSAAGESAIGEQIHAQILTSFYPYTEPRVVSYINGVGQSLSRSAERQDLSYRFTILYSDEIYATSAPGGFVYVTTGMLYYLQNEAELAAVLAHEIGELQYHDPRLSQTRKVLERMTRTGAVVAPAFGSIGMLAMLGLVAVNHTAGPHEKTPDNRIIEADRRALRYMLEAGYDPQGLLDLMNFFLTAQQKTIPFFYDYYQSRPISMERMQAIQAEFSKLPLEGKSLNTDAQEYQTMIKGIREMYRPS